MPLLLHTRNLTAGQSMVITGNLGVLMATYQMSSASGDSGTLLGNFSFKAANDVTVQPSQTVDIPAGGGNTFASADQRGLDFTITCTQGTLKVILGF